MERQLNSHYHGVVKKPLLLLAAVLAAVVASSAYAITYGQYDGSGHPNVGAMLRLSPTTGNYRIVCTGSLISPTVYLTASHCTSSVESQPTGYQDAWVTFDPTFSSSSTLPASAIHGTMYTNPLYTNRASDPQDIAVIVLDEPVRRVTLAQLPSAGLLDQMKQAGTLNGTRFTSVGYGLQEPDPSPGGIQHAFPMERWVSSGEFNALNKSWLKISQNDATGDGGTCSGDSGGPQFLGSGANETDTQVSITITGDTQCNATNVDYRLDTPQARAFLGQFVSLP
jgi:V8-like Glu-specific endopeptidase